MVRNNGAMTQIITLENDLWQVGLVPASGGSVAFGRVKVGNEWVDVMRPTPDEDLAVAADTASYPLVPWSNRIRTGTLHWAGRTYQLRVNFPDGTAIHGAGKDYPWSVIEQTPTRVTMEFRSRDVYGVNWPWTFDAAFSFELDGDRFIWTYGITNTDHETFPAGFGHHPYFERSIRGGADAVLQVNCELGYDLVDCMPTEAAGQIRPAADFRSARPIGQEFVDDCFTGRTGERLATIEWPGLVKLDVDADPLLGHAVLYIPPGKSFFAFEPVSNANDAFNLEDKGIHSTGLFLLQPGQTTTASFSLTATALN